MAYILLSVICSVLVSVLLRLATRFDFNMAQAIACNYVVALTAVALTLQPSLSALQQTHVPWPALFALGLLLPTIFLVLGISVLHAGIVRSDAAQRLSLVLSLLAAFTLFGQSASQLKIFACLLGLVAMAGMVWRDQGSSQTKSLKSWLYPLLVFLGFGVIDVLFKQLAASGLPLGTSLLIVFALALPIAVLIALIKAERPRKESFIAGVLLGTLNFGNIYFYLQAHRALPENPALVFAGMNLGVVILGAVVGLLAFRERLSAINQAGLALALLAIGLLTL